MAEIVLGPLLRYVSGTEATVWVETDRACEVGVLDHTTRTFSAFGHHYGLVRVEGLEPGTEQRYEVHLDGRQAWPPPDYPFPPPAIRTVPHQGPIRVAFGSCRVAGPHEPPYTLTKDQDPRGREVDALYALSLRMLDRPSREWPHVMMCLGDQVYADEVSPEVQTFISGRRDLRHPPGAEVLDFEEYTRLYWEAWGDPVIRWFLSTVSVSMIWDDHDVHDDWNTSRAWLQEMRSLPWWNWRMIGAISSYWVYQHIGNLSPRHLHEDEMFDRVCAADDGSDLLREFAVRADRETAGTRWSYCRDLDGARLLVMDSRAGRVLAENEHRKMVDDHEWEWIVAHCRGTCDHLLLGSSLPLLLAPGLHHLEAWSEAVCAGAWGGMAARLGERVRQGLDFEHWAAFDDSFDRLAHLMEEAATGEHGPPPASIVALSGDVHHAYLAQVGFRRGSGATSGAWQAVCSPMRNPLDAHERQATRFGFTRAGHAIGHLLARAAGVKDPKIRWRVTDGPWFDNVISILEIEGRSLHLRIEKTIPHDGHTDFRLETVLERRLA